MNRVVKTTVMVLILILLISGTVQTVVDADTGEAPVTITKEASTDKGEISDIETGDIMPIKAIAAIFIISFAIILSLTAKIMQRRKNP